MKQIHANPWLPERRTTEEGQPRRVGVEVELAGLDINTMIDCVRHQFGGKRQTLTKLEEKLIESNLGDFIFELDASYLKALAERQAEVDPKGETLASTTVDYVTRAAAQLVPWEIVTAPIEMASLHRLEPLVDELRAAGALGTRHSLHFAFGLHLNVELPTLETTTILNYLRAYFCLYDWIVGEEKIDLTRKMTTYIKHFDKTYIDVVIDPTYSPTQSELIEDYLKFNPTRNRSLDLLPLFAHINETQVRNVVDDPRIKPRPTFHYRLPNCDIDNVNWNISTPWRLWLEVEKLANDKERVSEMCAEYRLQLQRLTHNIDGRWSARTAEFIAAANNELAPL